MSKKTECVSLESYSSIVAVPGIEPGSGASETLVLSMYYTCPFVSNFVA